MLTALIQLLLLLLLFLALLMSRGVGDYADRFPEMKGWLSQSILGRRVPGSNAFGERELGRCCSLLRRDRAFRLYEGAWCGFSPALQAASAPAAALCR